MSRSNPASPSRLARLHCASSRRHRRTSPIVSPPAPSPSFRRRRRPRAGCSDDRRRPTHRALLEVYSYAAVVRRLPVSARADLLLPRRARRAARRLWPRGGSLNAEQLESRARADLTSGVPLTSSMRTISAIAVNLRSMHRDVLQLALLAEEHVTHGLRRDDLALAQRRARAPRVARRPCRREQRGRRGVGRAVVPLWSGDVDGRHEGAAIGHVVVGWRGAAGEGVASMEGGDPRPVDANDGAADVLRMMPRARLHAGRRARRRRRLAGGIGRASVDRRTTRTARAAAAAQKSGGPLVLRRGVDAAASRPPGACCSPHYRRREDPGAGKFVARRTLHGVTPMELEQRAHHARRRRDLPNATTRIQHRVRTQADVLPGTSAWTRRIRSPVSALREFTSSSRAPFVVTSSSRRCRSSR